MNLSQAAGTKGKSYKPESKAQVTCKSGFVRMNGRCMRQEQRNKKANTNGIQRNQLINKNNKKFYNA